MPPFLATEHHPVPSKDLLSWTFDDLPYDWDEPVSLPLKPPQHSHQTIPLTQASKIYIDALNPSNNISARRARTAIRQLAAGFKAIGLQPGDCVCIHSFNDIWYPIFFLGVIAAGGVYAGTNPAYTAHELAHALKTARVKYVLSQEALLQPVLKAASEVGLNDEKVILFNPGREDAHAGRLQWKDLFQHGEVDWPRFDSPTKAKNTTAALLFSSGTTGLPKAAMLSHHNFIAQHTLVYESPPVRPYKAIRLVALPMFHAASAPVAHTTPLRAGEKCYVLPRFELENWFWAHEKYAVTDVAMVPPVTLMAINSPLNRKYSLKSAKAGQVGAAPLDKHPQARMQELLGGKPLTQVWGMTETSCIATRFRYPGYDATGSVGVPLPGLDLKLVDEEGGDVTGFDTRGELCVRGPTVFRGYLRPDGSVDESCFDGEGFFRTGDVAFVERRTGLWYIVDRKKVGSLAFFFSSSWAFSCFALESGLLTIMGSCRN